MFAPKTVGLSTNPVIKAAKALDELVLGRMLDAGFDVEYHTSGWTPLNLLLRLMSPDLPARIPVLRRLISAGASPDHLVPDGLSARERVLGHLATAEEAGEAANTLDALRRVLKILEGASGE